MDLLLLLTYTAICVVIFKVFKVPLTKWTVPTAGLGGVVLIGALMLLMNYNHPHSRTAVYTFATTPILPNVRGLVIEVPVKANTPVKKGEVLFKIDPTPFEDVVAQKKATLAAAQSLAKQLQELLAQATSSIEKSKASLAQSKQSYDRYAKAGQSGGAAAIDIETRKQRLIAAKASLDIARSSKDRASLQLNTQIDSVIPQRQAELERAEFDLKSTVVRAPSDGFVTQLLVRPGMMAVPLPLRPVMVFVQKERPYLLANFRQNTLQRLEAGYEAEVLFKSIPGKVFKAKVEYPLPVLAEGELQAQGRLIKAHELSVSGLVPVVVKLDDERLEDYFVPYGISAEVAVYSTHLHHVAIVRKILFRMKSWQNFIYFDH